ncbi:MAG: signal peptide peptidase SppA [Acidobacteria bacterium]|nr:signal peptide peptidase SppA [Acidobacteriota bacterium]
MTKGAKTGLIIVLVVVVVLVGAGFGARLARQPSAGSVLEMTLREDIPEQAATDPLARLFGGKRLTMRDYIEALRRARDDSRINGLLVTVDGPGVGFARTQELRDAILDFQSTGKWAVAYLETAGEFSPGNRDYFLATACGSIWLAPPGDINLTGIRASVPFIRGTLDKLGIYPDYDHIGKYKTAKNLFTDTSMTEAYRESMDKIVDGAYGQMKRGIALGRKLSEDEVAALIDRGPFIGPQALEAKLVDSLGYRDQLEDGLKEKNGGSLPLMKVGRYLKSGRFYDRGVKVAVVYGEGPVTRGESDDDPFSGDTTMGSDTIAAAIKKAREDKSIKAIVFRVDSPGGSYVASDVIWREVSLTKGVKPIVVTMGDVAGSGGYFVSMAADRIIAEPGTITASIGVVAGKFITTGFWNKVGITSDAVQRGRHSTYFSSDLRYTPEERAIFQTWLERIYKDFVGKVAQGRGKTFDEIHAVAQGRIWLGEDALKLGLVDELGGLTAAIRSALDLAQLDPESRVRLVALPEPKSLFQRIISSDADVRSPFAGLRSRIKKMIEQGPFSGDQVLMMPIVPEIL